MSVPDPQPVATVVGNIGLRNSAEPFKNRGLFTVVNDITSNRLYIAEAGSNNVRVIDVEQIKELPPISMPWTVWSVEVDSNANKLYVTGSEIETYNAHLTYYDYRSCLFLSTIDPDTYKTISARTLIKEERRHSSGSSYPNNYRALAILNELTDDLYLLFDKLNIVKVIDAEVKEILATLAVGDTPVDIGIDSSLNKLFICSSGSNSIIIIDGRTLAVTGSIAVGQEPVAVAVDELSHRVYIANRIDENIYILDSQDEKLLDMIPLNSSPTGLAVDGNAHNLFISLSKEDVVEVINTETLESLGKIPVGDNPGKMTLDSSRRLLFVINMDGDNADRSVSIIKYD